MNQFEESRLRFEFGERWRVFKFDTHPYYRTQMKRLDDTKAIDFLGILDSKELYFIEVKNYRAYRIESKDKLPTLPVEVAQKIRDSLACMIAAYRNSSNSEHWKPYVELLCDTNHTIKVIVWIEEDFPPSHPHLRQKALASMRTKAFKQKLSWLTKRVLVCGSRKHSLPNLTVSFLPHRNEETK